MAGRLAKVLVTTKTYPSISTKYIETVCTAGILLDENDQPKEWIRLYPIPYRYLEPQHKYDKYAIIEAEIEKNPADPRKESYKVNKDSITQVDFIDTKENWQIRKQLILKLKRDSVSEIIENKESLGIIKPASILKTYWENDEREWNDKQRSVLGQQDLFIVKKDLEKIPYNFGYQYTCSHNGEEKKHRMSVIDWEIPALYRNCRNKAQGSVADKEKEAIAKVIEKLESLRDTTDLYFMVGNQQKRQHVFMIIGLFYPPLVDGEQMSLFALQ